MSERYPEPDSAAEQFADALRRLYRAAGRPPLSQVVRRADVPLTTSGLSDWLNGKAVPRSAEALRFLVGFLRAAAQRAGAPSLPTSEQWEQLRARAWAERHANRGGRPSRQIAPVSANLLGRVIGELDETDAFALEVHQAVTLEGRVNASALPPYLPRQHDQRLFEEVRLAEAGGSRLVLLVGGSSTGKTRACWEAIRLVLPHWRVWHPLTPRRPEALLKVLESGQVSAHTVIWLNEAQLYLGDGIAGRRIAAALQELVQQPTGPVLVIGSLWPQYLDALTGSGDPQDAACRHLVEAAHVIAVPVEFSDIELANSSRLIRSDPRLQTAAERGRRISQFLAGAFELEARYQQGDEPARAVLWAAMDSYRLGEVRELAAGFLRDAASAYLHPDAVQHSGPAWFEMAMAYLTRPCHGVAGPLALLRPDTYRLADYLDQLGRGSRSSVYPPAAFWDAVSTHVADPADLASFGGAAYFRGRIQRATQLHRQAAAGGLVDSWIEIVWILWMRGDFAGALDAARKAAELGDPSGLRDLADGLRDGDDLAGAEALYREAVSRGDNMALWPLAALRGEAGDVAEAIGLYRRVTEAGNPNGLCRIAELLEMVGDSAGAEAAASEAADVGYVSGFDSLAQLRFDAGNYAGAESIAVLAAARREYYVLHNLAARHSASQNREEAKRLYRLAVDLGNRSSLMSLMEMIDAEGDLPGAEAVAQEMADAGDGKALKRLAGRHFAASDRLLRQAADLGDVEALRSLAWRRRFHGEYEEAEALFREAVDRGDVDSLVGLAELRELAGDRTGAERFTRQAAEHGNRYAWSSLARLRANAGDTAGAERILRRTTAHGAADDRWQLAHLLDRSGNTSGADDVARSAADLGDKTPWRILAKTRAEAGNQAGAEAAAAEAGFDAETLQILARTWPADAERIYQQAADAGVTEALIHLAELRAKTGDHAGTESFLRRAIDANHDRAPWKLIEHLEEIGDHAGAEIETRRMIDRGSHSGLNHYAMLRRQAGDRAGADRIERFGLTDDGALASEWWNTTLLPTRQQPGQGG